MPLRRRPCLGQPDVGISVERRELECRLLLRKLRLCRRQIGVRLLDATGRVDPGLIGLQLRLAFLLLQPGDLNLGDLRSRLRLGQGRPRHVLSRSHLVIVEHRDDVSGFHAVALAHADIQEPAGRLWRDSGAVTLDPAAQRQDVAGS